MSSNLPTAFTIASGALSSLSAMQEAQAQRNQEDAAIAEAEYNAKQLRYDAQMARYEKATAFNQQLARGRQDIASGYGAMVAAGNYGSSAQAQIFGSALNLMKDLSAIQYKYDNDAIQKENAARILDYNKSVYKKNKTSALIGGLLNVAGAGVGTYLYGWDKGLWGPQKKTAVDLQGLYGHWEG